MKYELPPEPSVKHKVITTNGRIYEKVYEGVTYSWFNKESDTYRSWVDLLEMGVEDYTDPAKIGDVWVSDETDEYLALFKVYVGESKWDCFIVKHLDDGKNKIVRDEYSPRIHDNFIKWRKI